MNLEKVDKIVIKNKEELTNLLTWRDNNKELVRNFNASLSEGLIVYEGYQQYFRQDGNAIQHKAWINGADSLSVTIVKKSEGVLVLDSSIKSIYTGEKLKEYIQDVITVHASLMAYMEHYVHHVIKRTERVVKKKKGKAGDKNKNRTVKIGRKVYDVSVPISVSSEKRIYERHVESFSVKGHPRTYKKTGKTIWIDPYTKGDKEAEKTPRTYTL